MAKYAIEDTTLSAIAEAIREKSETADGLTPVQMPGAILAIQGAEAEERMNAAGGKTVFINSEAEGEEVVEDEDSGVPEGYTRLQYIESTGEQYINTGFTPNSNTRVVLNAYNLSADSGWTFGAWTSATSLQYAFSCKANYSFRYGSANVNLADVPVGDVSVDFNKNAYNLNGTSGTLTAQNFTCAYSMYLFAINAAGAASSGKFIGRWEICRIYDNGTLVRDYEPYKNESGVVGLYDKVNGVFYSDVAGVGFVAGPEKKTGVSKVVLEDEVLIDLTSDTVTPESLLSGFTAHNALGQLIEGLAKAGGGRPLATGTFQPTSIVSSYTVSGLDFQPSIVVAVWDTLATGPNREIVAALFQDAENSFGRGIYFRYDDYIYGSYGTFGSGNYATMKSDGFTLKVSSGYYMSGKYYWYAFGAEG